MRPADGRRSSRRAVERRPVRHALAPREGCAARRRCRPRSPRRRPRSDHVGAGRRHSLRWVALVLEHQGGQVLPPRCRVTAPLEPHRAASSCTGRAASSRSTASPPSAPTPSTPSGGSWRRPSPLVAGTRSAASAAPPPTPARRRRAGSPDGVAPQGRRQIGANVTSCASRVFRPCGRWCDRRRRPRHRAVAGGRARTDQWLRHRRPRAGTTDPVEICYSLYRPAAADAACESL